ncbi:formate/nitrite transporter family protein [Paraburkholderia sp. CNPSo 3272]|uniref:formate/nitrite transporter family protein n=1 Tax=Paraburkholderia sp. CNPSo 3272 TaxID=2940931 RepID=UPI0020B69D12|nr:formate/nitrite transporter family protein [Paraburkholderia sp. CNPSo 3272]MCP3722380.1 formate/nitrite transporter family protein [Paraburkholderia sp. CNPSo 3272]
MPELQAGADSPHLDDSQREQAAEHSTPHPLVIHEIVREEGETAMGRTFSALMWSALAAGMSMGFSFLAQAIVESALPATTWRHLISSIGYSMGFVFVILGRQQLFTESTLTAVLPVLVRRDLKTIGRTLRLWSIVLFFNLMGTTIFAAMLQFRGVFSPEIGTALANVAHAPFSGDFGVTVVRGVFAGWLIALMVWLLPSARAARLSTILLVTYTVGVSGLAHVIAGSAEAAYAVMIGVANIGDYFVVFLFPTLIGNVIGGVAMVAIVNHAAIAPEIAGAQRQK